MLPQQKIIDLVQEAYLVEDPNTGVIQLAPEGYTLLHKPLPKVFDQKAVREKIEKLTKSYLELWPAKVMSGSRLVKQGPGAIRKKLTTFLRKYPKFTDEEILEATRRYIHKLKQQNYQYMICSDYFIEKDGVSQLEAYIIAVQVNATNAAAGVKPVNTSIHERTL